MPEKLTTGPVYIGQNKLVISHATMNRIVQDWIHVNHSGGPYQVTAISGDDDEFEVSFQSVEPAKDTP